MAPGGVVVVPSGGDESASLLDDDDGSPVPFAACVSHPPPLPPPLHGKATTRTPAGHAFTRLIRSPFAAVRRMTTCADTDAISPSVEQPTSKMKMAAGAVVEHRREARRTRRPSLEQLITMETTAPPPLPTTPSRPGRRSKPDTTTSSKVSIRTTAVKEKRAHEPLSLPKSHRTAVVVSDDERRRAAPAPAPALFKSDASAGDRQGSTKRLVVVFESLRACSRAPGIAVGVPTKGLSRKKVSAAGGCVPAGKAELFYYRPIPMGRRCRVQHLEETPYK